MATGDWPLLAGAWVQSVGLLDNSAFRDASCGTYLGGEAGSCKEQAASISTKAYRQESPLSAKKSSIDPSADRLEGSASMANESGFCVKTEENPSLTAEQKGTLIYS